MQVLLQQAADLIMRDIKIYVVTRLHSSRMHTVRCSGRLRGVSTRRAVPRGCLPGGVCQGVSAQREVSAWGGCLPRQTPPHVKRITVRCKNNTLPQLLLQTVKRWLPKRALYTSFVGLLLPTFKICCSDFLIQNLLSLPKPLLAILLLICSIALESICPIFFNFFCLYFCSATKRIPPLFWRFEQTRWFLLTWFFC